MNAEEKKIRLTDVYIHDRVQDVIVSRKNTQEEINARTRSIALQRLLLRE